MTIVKRNKTYQYSGTIAGVRLRFSLGCRLPQAANTLSRQIGAALAEGPDSVHWQTLKTVLPKASWEILTANRGIKPSPELSEFETAFTDKLDRRVKLGELAERSRDLYAGTATMFFQYLANHDVKTLGDISSARVEDYLVQRKEDILKRGGNGKGIQTDYTVLQSVFNFAQGEGLIRQSPLKIKHKTEEKKPDAVPFTPEEMERLESCLTDEDQLPFALLRWTGMRGSDAAAVTWSSINWTTKTLTWQTKKRRTWVQIPLHGELLLRLASAVPADKNSNLPILGGLTRARLYKMLARLGKCAGVEDCFPHKLRTTLVCSLLARGASLFDVSKLIGDSCQTVEKYYSAITAGQQDRVRKILESSGQTPDNVVDCV
jgi:integrase